MTTITLEEAVEQSTYVLNIAFADEDKSPITPNSATWTLTDDEGTVINSKDAVPITELSANKDVVLSGNDLAIKDAYYGNTRVFLVEYVYDSSLGNDLPAKTQAYFDIENLVAVI